MKSKDKMLSVLKSVYKAFMLPLTSVERKKSFDGLNGILFSENMTQNSDWFYQYSRLKKTGESYDNPCADYSEYGIVLQGPVLYDGDFTLTTLKTYQRYFPKAHIILSTWDSENKDFIEEASKMGISCVLSKLPSERGAGNLNCQLVSSKAGVDAARACGCKYIAKTRTDQRFSHPQWLDYVKSLLDAFPVNGDKQKERIVFMESNGTYKYIAFHVCDFFAFGRADDICNYYNTPLDIRAYDFIKSHQNEINQTKAQCIPYEIGPENVKFDYSEIGKSLLELQISEFYILYSYVKTYICNDLRADNLLEKYRECLKSYFCIADSAQMQFYWPKYRRKYELLSKTERDGKLDFASWLRIYLW